MTKPEDQESPIADADSRNDDDLIDRLIEHNPRFRRMLEERRNENSISIEEARKRFGDLHPEGV